VIKELAAKFGFEDRADIVRDDAERFIMRTDSSFDIIFVDPPYASDQSERILPLIAESGCLNAEGIVIVEHFSKKSPDLSVGILSLLKTYKYGDTSLSMYGKSDKAYHTL
jgi:16S rRNA G966 N2-methylase RsmD